MRSFDSIGMTIGLALAVALASGVASAQLPPKPARPVDPHPRTDVLLVVVGPAAPGVHSSLVGLLDGQLHAMSLSLLEQQPRGSVSDWVTAATRSKRALLAIVLDTTSSRGWRLVVVDVARGRAIARELPGGVEQDAASVEAVASIVISAASALREGLEVASAPVEAVIGPAQNSAPKREAAPEVRHDIATRNVAVHGSVGAALTSFAGSAPVTLGGTLALGLGWRRHLEARVFGTLFLPVRLQSEFGEFRVNRAILGMAGGPVFTAQGFSFSPEVGLLMERLRRSGTLPAQGLSAAEAEPLHRFGGLAELRLRRTLLRPFSLELVAGGAYLGQSVQFSVRKGNLTPFFEIGPTLGFAHLGIDIATD